MVVLSQAWSTPRRLFLTGLLCSLLFLCHASLPIQADSKPGNAKNLQTTATVSYKPLSQHGLPLVSVRLNGQVTAHLFLDTGTNVSLLSGRIASQLGLIPQPATKNGLPFFVGGEQGQAISLASLQIGAILVPQPTLLVVPTRPLSALFEQRVDGILGMDLLQAFALRLNTRTHQITFWSPGHLTNTQRTHAAHQIGMGVLTPVPMLPRPDGVFVVQAEAVSGHGQAALPLVVDTGADHSSLSPAAAHQLHLVPSGPPRAIGIAQGQVTVSPTVVPILRLGQLTLHHTPMSYAEDAQPPLPLSLGMDIFSSTPVLMDFPARLLYLGNGKKSSH